MELKLYITRFFSVIVCTTFAAQVAASTLTIPNSFSAGGTASASEMNANFTAIKSSVDDNNARIAALESATPTSSVLSFRGFSTGLTNGGNGLVHMGGLCAATFSGSRICSTDDFLAASYDGASGLVGSAWVLYSDESSLKSSDNCSGWSSSSTHTSGGSTVWASGWGIDATGAFDEYGCEETIAVACCK